MNQKQYIRSLNRRLYLFVPWEERQDILADYREYFSDAASQGESEAAVIEHLGTPSTVAREILSDRGVFILSKEIVFKAILFGTVLVLFGLALWCVFRRYRAYPYYSDFNYFLYQYTPTILLIIAGIHFLLRSQWRGKAKSKNRTFWIVTGAVSFFIILGVILTITLFLIPSLHAANAGENQSTTGPRIALIYLILTVPAFGAWLWNLLSSRNRSPMCQAANFWYAGLIGTLYTGFKIISELDDPSYLYSVLIWIEWLGAVTVGIVLTGIAIGVAFLVRFLVRKLRRGSAWISN